MSEAAAVLPRESDARKSKSLRPLRELLGFLWPHKSRLIIASAALVFTAMTQLSLGYGIQILIDQGFPIKAKRVCDELFSLWSV